MGTSVGAKCSYNNKRNTNSIMEIKKMNEQKHLTEDMYLDDDVIDSTNNDN